MKIFKYLLSFLIPMVFLFIISSICGYYPVGSKSFIIFDAYHEYSCFLMELGNILHSGKTLFYTLHGALGTNFLSILNIYMGSPLNLFVYFFNNQNIYLFYTLLIYLKIGLSGLTMYIYLNSINTKYKDTMWNIMFSSIYALSGYAMAFNIHIMWMDAYILLPLIIKYLDKLIIESKGLLYSIFLAILLIINYYMGFMVCIFLGIYFIYKTLIDNKLNKKSILNFLIYSILAVGLAAVILIPNIITLKQGRLSALDFSSLFKIHKFTLLSLVYNMTPGSFFTLDNFNDGSTTTYCTLFCIILIIKLFLNKKVSKKEKIVTGIVLSFFALSFSFSLIDYAWTIFQRPVWWFHRYQFVFIFLIILIAYRSFFKIENVSLRKKQKIFIMVIYSVILLASFTAKQAGLNMPNYYVVFMFIGLIIFFLYIQNRKNGVFLVLLILLELGINAYVTLKNNIGLEYNEIKVKYINTKESIDNVFNDEYRIIDLKGGEDNGLLFNYNSVSLFSSSYNNRTANFMAKVGVEELSLNHQAISNYDPSILSLLGVKYILNDKTCENEICINPYAMPLVYEVNEAILKVNLEDNKIVDNINKIYSALLNEDVKLASDLDSSNYDFGNIKVNEDNIITDIYRSSEINIHYTAEKEELIFFKEQGLYYNSEILINNNEYNLAKNPILHLLPKDQIDIKFKELGNFLTDNSTINDFYIYKLDLKKYETSIKKLYTQTNFEYKTDNKYILKGDIESSGNIILLTIPYDKSLKIFVDGKNVDYFPVLDTFVGIDLDSGHHNISVKYFPEGLKQGMLVSAVSLILLFLFDFKKKNK